MIKSATGFCCVLAVTSCSSLSMSGKLDRIGFFDYVDNQEKLRFIKENIDKHYNETGWLYFPNDYYVSDMLNIPENGNGSSTSDFRALDVSPIDMFRGCFESYMCDAKPVFEKRGLQFVYKDETIEEKAKEDIKHTITVNGDIYLIYEGCIGRDRHFGEVVYKYMTSCVDILNRVLQKQKSDERFIILGGEDANVYFILADEKLKNGLRKIIGKAKNRME